MDLGLLCGKLPRFFLQLAELGLGGALRLVGLRAASLEGGLLRGEIVRLPLRGLLGLLREERASLGIVDESFGLLGLDGRRVSRRLELLQFFRALRRPPGAFGLERLPHPEKFIFLGLEFGQARLGPLPGGLRLRRPRGVGLRLGIQLRSLKVELGCPRPDGPLPAFDLFRAFGEFNRPRLRRRIELGLRRSEGRLLILPLLALFHLLGVEFLDGLVDLAVPRVQVLLSANERHRLCGQLGQLRLCLVFLGFQFPRPGLQIFRLGAQVRFLSGDGLLADCQLLRLGPERVLERRRVAFHPIAFRAELGLLDRKGLTDRFRLRPHARRLRLVSVFQLGKLQLIGLELPPCLLDRSALLLQPALVRSEGFLGRDNASLPIREIARLGLEGLGVPLKLGIDLMEPLRLGRPLPLELGPLRRQVGFEGIQRLGPRRQFERMAPAFLLESPFL